MTNLSYSLQGQVFTGIRNTGTGKPGALTWLGNVSKFDISLTPDISDKYESFSGNRLLYGRLVKSKKGDVSMTVDEFKLESLLLALYAASSTTISGTTVTGETFPTAMTVGQSARLAHDFASAVTIHDSTGGTPLVLVAGTDYTVNGSTITINNLGSYVQPFVANYTYAAAEQVAMLSSATPPERYIVFDGVDTNTGYKVSVDLFRVQFVPAKTLSLIDSDWGTFDLDGACLYDSVNATNANYGGFGRIQTNAPST